MFENLKKLRKELGLTQAQFAEKLGIPQTTYAGYEKGNSDPPAWFWLAVADRYRVSIDYLMGHTDDPHRTKYAARSKVEADYYGLDDHGRRVVDAVMEIEAERGRSTVDLSDYRMVARSGRKLTPDQMETARKVIEAMEKE